MRLLNQPIHWLSLALTFSSVAFAAGGTPEFYGEVALLVVISAVVAFISFRLGLVPIIGFLLTGVLLNSFGVVSDPELINAVAELGVILLLFTIGIEFSLDNVMRIQRLIFLGGGTQVFLTILVVLGLCLLLGSSWQEGVFSGMLIALSSTAIVMKLLASRGETSQTKGQISLGFLVFQDLAVVAMVIIVPFLGGEGGSWLDITLSLGSAVLIIAVILFVARRVMPRVLEALAMTCSQEIFLLGVIGICFGTAYLTGLAGVSLSLGAFLAGLLVSESRFGKQALGEILPLQILFSAAFFVSVGLLLDVPYMLSHLPLVLGIIAIILVVKASISTVSAKILGYTTGTSFAAAVMLAQVGEFSFVLERAGREVGLLPAGLAEGGQVFIASTVLLMAATPFLSTFGDRLAKRIENKTPTRSDSSTPKSSVSHEVLEHLSDHVIIAGFGPGGKRLAMALKYSGIDHLVLTLSPTGAMEAEAENLLVMQGDYATRFILEEAGILKAKAVVIADDDAEHSRRVLEVIRGISMSMPVMIRLNNEQEALELEHLGASLAVSQEQSSVFPILRDILERYQDEKVDYQQIRDILHATRNASLKQYGLDEAQLQSKKCSHQSETQTVTANAGVCLDCVREGKTWVHLRICLTCGYVGCCDDSEGKHATAHFHETEHPIMRSLEEGEDWAWCFVDKTTL